MLTHSIHMYVYTDSLLLVLQAELGPGPVLLTKAVVITKVTPMLDHVFAQCALWLWIHVHFRLPSHLRYRVYCLHLCP